MSKFYWFAIFLIFSVSCQINKQVNEGLSGTVLWFEGDLMPGINKTPAPGKPIAREILIYEKTSTTDCLLEGGFFCSKLDTKLVATVHSDQHGNFSVRLKPGTYSVFVREDKGLFAKTFNENGIINPVTVNPNEVSVMLLRVDYMAAY